MFRDRARIMENTSGRALNLFTTLYTTFLSYIVTYICLMLITKNKLITDIFSSVSQVLICCSYCASFSLMPQPCSMTIVHCFIKSVSSVYFRVFIFMSSSKSPMRVFRKTPKPPKLKVFVKL